MGEIVGPKNAGAIGRVESPQKRRGVVILGLYGGEHLNFHSSLFSSAKIIPSKSWGMVGDFSVKEDRGKNAGN